MIGVLDVDIGNLRSITNAVYAVGYEFAVIDRSSGLDDVTHLIIPGVGSYAQAMCHIGERELKNPIRKFAASGRPVLGICLGMQLLSDTGEEGGPSSGLELISGRTTRLTAVAGLRLPHMGWNTVIFRTKHPVFGRLRDGADFYFVHSYHLQCRESSAVAGETEYGRLFTSIAGRGNVLGFQFHPEKSQTNGLRLIENFCGWDGQC